MGNHISFLKINKNNLHNQYMDSQNIS